MYLYPQWLAIKVYVKNIYIYIYIYIYINCVPAMACNTGVRIKTYVHTLIYGKNIYMSNLYTCCYRVYYISVGVLCNGGFYITLYVYSFMQYSYPHLLKVPTAVISYCLLRYSHRNHFIYWLNTVMYYCAD